MSKGNKLVIGLVGLATLFIFFVGMFLTTKSQPRALTASGEAKVEVLGPVTHDWGQIDIDGDIVEKVFQIKNSGTGDLEMTNFKTSCMCTEAQVSLNDTKSPVFGMHTRSGWSGVLKPGELADVIVAFDPLFHGPQGTGPITRLVSFNTNDSTNSTVEFKLTGNVIKVTN